MAAKNSFMFLCDQATESECLKKQLVGTTQLNAITFMGVQAEDDIYLFNFNTGVIRGPYSAETGIDCHDPTAWGGNFPVQVKIHSNPLTKKSNLHTEQVPHFLKKKRPHGNLGDNSTALFEWIQKFGTQIE